MSLGTSSVSPTSERCDNAPLTMTSAGPLPPLVKAIWVPSLDGTRVMVAPSCLVLPDVVSARGVPSVAHAVVNAHKASTMVLMSSSPPEKRSGGDAQQAMGLDGRWDGNARCAGW